MGSAESIQSLKNEIDLQINLLMRRKLEFVMMTSFILLTMQKNVSLR